MDGVERAELELGGITPEGLARLLPSRPVLASPHGVWEGVALQRYRHPPSTIEVAGLRDDLLVDHLAGPVLVEDDRGDGHFERRWTGPGQISLTPAGQRVHRVLKGRPDVVLVHIKPALVRDAARELGVDDRVVRRFAVPDEVSDRLVRSLMAEAASPGPGTGLMAGALTRALALHLLRLSPAFPAMAPPTPSIAPARLRRVIERMRAALDEDLPVERLAGMAGLGASQFTRSFRHATGQPPHRYLTGLRMERAQLLLETTDLPVTEIGFRCGFTQASHFATAFRRHIGQTPRDWRLNRQG